MTESNSTSYTTNQTAPISYQASNAARRDSSPPVNLNQADLNTLMSLPGIGEKMAKRIIRYRETIRPFQSPVEITTIPGISMAMYDEFADQVTISSPGEATIEEVSMTDENLQKEPDSSRTLNEERSEAKATNDETVDEGYLLMWGQEPTADKPTKPADEKIEEATPEMTTNDSQDNYIIEAEEADDLTNFRRPWILMIVGALLGAFIALALMYAVNGGTLSIADHPKVVELENELAALKQREAALTETLEALRAEVSQYETLNTQLQSSKAEIEILKQSRDNLAGQISVLEAENDVLTTRATTLETNLSAAAEQIATLEQDTGRFDGFLSGLRDLLSPDNGIAPAVEATPTSTN